MKKKRIFSFFAMSIFLPVTLYAAGKAIAPVSNQTVTSIGGANSSGDIVPFTANDNGSFQILEKKNAMVVAVVTITGNGATQRTQFPSNSVNFCTMKADASNNGKVYIGPSTVTNASGANPGFPLGAGDALSAIRVDNSNELYGAADNANDKISVICN